MANENQNLLNYVDYDFIYLIQQLQDRVKLADTWKDTYRSSTGQMLIELYAYVANLVLYYVERRAAESYLDTAQLKSSIINIVKLLNYQPKRRVSATGKLTFSLATISLNKVFIPKYTECQTSSALKYLTTQDVVIMPGSLNVTVGGIQGSIVEVTQVSDGSLNYELKLLDADIENTNLFVFVDGVEWTKVDSFIDSTNTSTHYRAIQEIDDTVTLRFGNNIFGKAPSNGQTILVRYIKSDGLAGNVYELGKVTQVNSVIFDDTSTVVDTTVINSDVFLGGDDAESAEEIRAEAPRVFKTGDRAVNKEDYIALLENYAGIATANAWGENEENPPNYTMFNRVKLVVLLEEWALPSVTFKQQLSDYLYTKSMLTVKYEYINPIIIYAIPVLDVKVARTGSLSAVQSNVETALTNEFILGDTTKLGISKRLSDLVHKVEIVDGLSYHHMYLVLRKVLPEPFDSFYTFGTYLDLLSVLPRSVKIYVGTQQVAVDDGAGAFINLLSAYTVTGLVNYTTGYLGVNIAPPPGSGDVVSVRYQQNQSGDLVIGANQILRLYEVDITNISFV